MSRLRTLPIIVVSVVVTLLLSSLIHPLFAASAAGPGYASIVGPAFQPVFTSTSFRYFHMQVRTETGSGFYVAPLSVPQGATLNQMTLLGYDDDPSNVLQVTLYRAFGGRGFIEQIATLDSTGANADFELSTTTDLARSVVDNEKYGYYVELTLPAPSAVNFGLVLSRVRVGYDYAQNLPVVVR